MSDRRRGIEEALGPSMPRPVLDRDRVFETVQGRLRRHRKIVVLGRVLAVGAVLLVAAIALLPLGEDGSRPSSERALASQDARPAPEEASDWLAIAQARGTRMATRQTADGVRIELREGGVAAEVRPGTKRRLEIETGTATIRVTGTTVAVSVADSGSTRVAVGSGQVVVSPRGGEARAVRAGEGVSVAERVTPVSGEDRTLGLLLASLPGRWHERAAPPAPEPPVAEADPAVTPTGAAASFASRGCDALEEATRIADGDTVARRPKREALELLARCARDPRERAGRLEALVALVPSHPVAWLDLGRLRERAGDSTNAALAYRTHLDVAGTGPLADEGALALCRVSWDRRACLERFLAERSDSDRRREAESQLEALQR